MNKNSTSFHCDCAAVSCVTCFLYFGRGVPTRQFLPSPAFLIFPLLPCSTRGYPLFWFVLPQSPLLFPAADRSCTCSSAIWARLSSWCSKAQAFPGLGGDKSEGIRSAKFCIQGGKGFLHPKLGAFAYLLNRNRLLCVGKPDLVHRFGFEICEWVDEQDFDRVRFLFLLIAPVPTMQDSIFHRILYFRRNS